MLVSGMPTCAAEGRCLPVLPAAPKGKANSKDDTDNHGGGHDDLCKVRHDHRRYRNATNKVKHDVLRIHEIAFPEEDRHTVLCDSYILA